MSIYKGQEKVLPNVTVVENPLPKIEYGTIDFALPASSDSTYLLTFKNTYVSVPTVVATVGSKTATWGYNTISVTSQSNTNGCHICVHNLENVERNLTINYIVIGK